MTTVAEVRADTNRFRDEIHTLVLRNTKLQREIMTLNTGRERAAAQGTQMAQELSDELAALDDELRRVRAQCHSMRRTLSSQRSEVDRLGEQMSSESSMSSTRFRRMSSAILGPNGGKHGGGGGDGQLATPTGERSRGMSIASSAMKRRDSVMMRFKGTLASKKANPGSTPRAHDGDGSGSFSDDNRVSVNIDEVSPLPSPMPLSAGSGKSIASSSSSSGGRPPLRNGSSSNVLHYKASDEKKSVADSHKEHLSNFRRSSRSSRKVLDTSGAA